MGTHRSDATLSRRKFLGSGALIGAGGLAALTFTPTDRAFAANPRFSNLKPMRPAPQTFGGTVPTPPLASLVLNKAGYGPRPGDVDAFNALGGDDASRMAAWVDLQLNPTVADPELDNRMASYLGNGLEYDTINKSLTQLWSEHARFEGNDEYQARNRPRWQMERLIVLRALYSRWQFREVMNDFWFNHFNVTGDNFPAQSMLPHYDREIRSHIFGNFHDMLEANARTASMLYYLDNYRNSWPNPNENYAREVLELHTLGAIENYYGAIDPSAIGNNSQGQRAGYCEIDVFEFAKALTGWGVADGDDDAPDTGEFLFRSDRHYDEHGSDPIRVLDVTLSSDGGENDVTDILRYLADHYGTARFMAWKMCTRLVGDNPDQALVASTADQFYNRRNDSDQLKEVYRHILMSSQFQSTWGSKVKRPLENIFTAMRATDIDIDFRNDHNPSNQVFNRLDDTGHKPYDNETPTGFPDEKALWSGSGPLVTSWRTITYFLRRSGVESDGELEYFNLAEQANTQIPSTANRTPTLLVDMWMLRLRGYGYDSAIRNRMITYVSDRAGVGATQSLQDEMDTDNLANNSQYQEITYTLVGLILMSPDAIRR